MLPGFFHAQNSVLTARFDEFERKFAECRRAMAQDMRAGRKSFI